MPFRDRRLGRLMARSPAAFAVHGGIPRAPARALMRGRLPDEIVLRQSKMAFSPLYHAMLRDQGAASPRPHPCASQGRDMDWLDLDWLQLALGEAAGGNRLSDHMCLKAQSTAMAAEFFHCGAT